MRESVLVAISALTVSFASIGCSDSGKPGSNVSTIQGTLQADSFPNKTISVAAVDEKSVETTTKPDAAGKFSLSLTKGHLYSLEVRSDVASEPVVYARIDGSVNKAFRVSSGNAKVDLGKIRHLDAVPAAGFSILGTPEGDAAAADCVDGLVSGTGAICVDDQTTAACLAGATPDNQADGECVNGVDTISGLVCTDPVEATGAPDGECVGGVDQATGATCTDPAETGATADGECANGVDQTTGLACTDDDNIDESLPIAVPEHNAPENVGGCLDAATDGEAAD